MDSSRLNIFLEEPTNAPVSVPMATAVSTIQLWWKKYSMTKSVLQKLKSVKGSVILKALNCKPSEFDSFETAHQTVFNEGFFDEISKFVDAAYFSLTERIGNDSKSPLSPTAVKREKMAAFRTTRIIASSVIISKYPQDMLCDGGDMVTQGIETRKCATNANLVIRAIRNVLLATEKQSSHARVYERLVESELATNTFLAAFSEWKRVDSVRILKAVESSFVESYNMLLNARAGGTSTSGTAVLESQVQKIKTTMVKLVGESQAVNRIEEICAAIEASMPLSFSGCGGSNINGSGTGGSNGMDFSALLNDQSPSTKDNDTASKTSAHSLAPPKPAASSSSQPSPRQAAQASMQGILTAAKAMSMAGGDTEDSAAMVQSLKMLDKLSQIAGIENERLAYEISFDKFFSLPSKPAMQPSHFPLVASISDDSSLGVLQILRMKMLRLMGDKLVNSLLPSDINFPSTATALTPALESYLNRIVMVKFQPSSPPGGPIAAVSPAVPVLTAKITAIHCGNNVVSSTHTVERVASSRGDEDGEDLAKALELSVDVAAGSDARETQIQHQILLDVEYLADGTKEQSVTADRVKQPSDSPDPTLFLQLLDDLCRQIASLVPNRPDIRAQIYQPLDFDLLKQMIEKAAITGTTDVLPLLVHLVQQIKELQAPSRGEAMVAWLNEFFSKWYRPNRHPVKALPALGTISPSSGSSPDDDTTPLQAPESEPAQGSTGVSSSLSLGDPQPFSVIIPLLPVFFEKTNEFIEQIQRDLANFYIGTLAPVMASHAGKEFLQQRFMQRVEQRVVSLDATASLFMAQIAPSNTPTDGLPGTIAELSDAGLSPADLTLACIRDKEPSARAVACKSLLVLLQIPLRIDGQQARALQLIPEPLEWDASRLAVARDTIDRIALESSLVIAARQLLGPYRVLSVEEDEIELQIRLDVLLSDGKETNMTTIAAEVEKYLTHALLRARQAHSVSLSAVQISYDAKELREKADKCVRDTVSPGNAVLSLLTKRVYKVVLRSLLKQPYLHKLPSFSLSSKAQERNLKSVLGAINEVFNHNWEIHAALYRSVLTTLCDTLATMGSPDESFA